MAKSLVLGNGSMFVGFGARGQVQDFFYPYVGLENQAGGGCVHRVGIFADGRISWLYDHDWQININYRNFDLVSEIHAVNNNLGIEIIFTDTVYNERPIFLRNLKIKNLRGGIREFKIFFNQWFKIYGTPYGDTAFVSPSMQSIVHYKGKRVFIVSGKNNEQWFDDYSVGISQIEGHEGTWKDAEDGWLSKNPVEHGMVDSTIGFTMSVATGITAELYYWICAGKSLEEAEDNNAYILNKHPAHLLQTTGDFWRAWVNKYNFVFHGLSDDIVRLYKLSLLITRAHSDNEGGIIASGDSDMLKYGRDTYAYVWMRDAAFSALALDKAGYPDLTKNFYTFANDVLSKDGYFYHKYRSDKSLGSTWHPWVRNGAKQLGIQEDETAVVLFCLWEHYHAGRDLEFIESIYNSLIKKSAEFLVEYRDSKSGLPKESYELWEERYGVSAFTSAAVYGGLKAGASFASLLGKNNEAERYKNAAHEVKRGIENYFLNPETKFFYKLLHEKKSDTGTEYDVDKTLDISSFFGMLRFGVFSATDNVMVQAFATIKEWLCCKTPTGGAARYENDRYFKEREDIPGNPWIITTLWFVQYYIEIANNDEDLDVVREWLKWVVQHAGSAGMLPEQINPSTGVHVSATPLAWSHAEYILTVIKYLEKLAILGLCTDCYPLLHEHSENH